MKHGRDRLLSLKVLEGSQFVVLPNLQGHLGLAFLDRFQGCEAQREWGSGSGPATNIKITAHTRIKIPCPKWPSVRGGDKAAAAAKTTSASSASLPPALPASL